MKFTTKKEYKDLLLKLMRIPPTNEEIDKAVDDFYLILQELNKDYPVELTRGEFGTTIGSIKQIYKRPLETEKEFNSLFGSHYNVSEDIEIEILLTFTPSGKILVAYKKDETTHYIYRITKGEISFLMDILDEDICLKNNKIFIVAREIAEKIKEALAPNSVKFIKED